MKYPSALLAETPATYILKYKGHDCKKSPPPNDLIVTLHRILMLKVKARARHAFTLKQKNLF